ncbi:MAG: hypothetical protein KC613_23130, partial [Myxococcales bacterium]|nr:hypothetical protein [Myxococcales bacterium]
PRARWRWPLGLGLAAATAVAAVVLLTRTPSPPGEPTETILSKGQVGLRVFRRRGDVSTELVSGDAAQAGDRLRFVAEGGSPDGFLLVLGVEADGDRFPYLPADGQARPASELDGDGALPGAAALDGSRGRERAVLVWCAQPFSLKDVGPGTDGALAVPQGCQQAAFEIVKP